MAGGVQPGPWKELTALPVLASLLEGLKSLRNVTPQERLSPAMAARLYGPDLRTSVSAHVSQVGGSHGMGKAQGEGVHEVPSVAAQPWTASELYARAGRRAGDFAEISTSRTG